MYEQNDTPNDAQQSGKIGDVSSQVNPPSREPEVTPLLPPVPDVPRIPEPQTQPQQQPVIGSVSASGPTYYPPMMQAQTNAWAIISIVSSILAWVGLFGIGGLIGVIAGWYARNEIKKSNGAQTGDSLALVGIILGGVNIALACIGIMCVMGLAGLGIFGAMMDAR